MPVLPLCELREPLARVKAQERVYPGAFGQVIERAVSSKGNSSSNNNNTTTLSHFDSFMSRHQAQKVNRGALFDLRPPKRTHDCARSFNYCRSDCKLFKIYNVT